MIRKIIYIYFPNTLGYIRILRSFFLSVSQSYKTFKIELSRHIITKKAKKFSSQSLTHEDVQRALFEDLYQSILDLKLLYLGMNSLNHQFIFIANQKEPLLHTVKQLLDRGFIIEVKTKKSIIILHKNSQKNIQKILNSFVTLHIYRLYSNKNNIIEFGLDIAIKIEHWFKTEQDYTTYAKNSLQNRLTKDDIQDTKQIFLYNLPIEQLAEFHTYFAYRTENRVEDIDLVYTWVNDQDSVWQQRKNNFLKKTLSDLHISATSKNRYSNKNELLYSLRSVHKYLTGYRKIFIVVDDQRPDWLKESKNIILVDHKEIFPDKNALPTFNSHAIEANLHHIDGLSEHYLYLNDDIIFGRSFDASFFFPQKGFIYIYPSQTTYIPFGKSHQNLLPVDSAAINARELLHKQCLGYAMNKYKHTPLPQIKSKLKELDSIFKKEIQITSQHRFRHPKDISLTSSLFFNYAYFIGIASIGNIKYSYINLNKKDNIFRLKKMLYTFPAYRPDVFCINDVAGEYDHKKTANYFTSIMEKFLSEKSIFEY